MYNLQDIKHRIKSVSDTKQITKAMELISISKMQKARQKYENNLTYFEKVRYSIKDILTHTHDIKHEFLHYRKSSRKRTIYIVIAADKGMAGGYNHDVLNFAWEHMKGKKDKYVFTIGEMAKDFFERKGQMIDAEFTHSTVDPTLFDARSIAENLIELYQQKAMDEVLVVFTRMHSMTKKHPTIIKLLPVEMQDFEDVELNNDYSGDIQYDPSPKDVFDVLIPQYIIGLLYAILVQAAASEHSSRMLAMGSATKNADEMLENLRVSFNRVRQSKITDEIAEIVSASSLVLKE